MKVKVYYTKVESKEFEVPDIHERLLHIREDCDDMVGEWTQELCDDVITSIQADPDFSCDELLSVTAMDGTYEDVLIEW